MNTVKRCLAVIAATWVIGGCGGDPTAPGAGADLHIRATPGAVWMRNNTIASVNIEAVDKLGGPVQGSWTVGTIVGPFAAALDTAYQSTTAGPLSVKAKFNIDPATEGEGSVVFNGTGGTITVPVRIAPDTSAFAVTISSLTPLIGDTVTVTAPAGTRFTAGTTVNFYDGALPLNLQQGATPQIVTIVAPDSTVLKVVPPAGAKGQMRITGVSNPSTPTLVTTARSAALVALVDTKTLTGTFSSGPIGVPVNSRVDFTLTQPGYRFRTGAGAAADTTAVSLPFGISGLQGGVLTVINADSLHIGFFPPPGYHARATPTKLFNAKQGFYNLSLPMFDSLKVDSLPQAGLGQDDPAAGPVGLITLPAMAAGDKYVFWDNGTFTAPDNLGIGQHDEDKAVEIVITTAGRYRFSVSWDGSASAPDIDNYLFNGTLTGLRADCVACNTNPEVLTTSSVTPLAAGSHQFWVATVWDGDRPSRMRVIVTRIS